MVEPYTDNSNIRTISQDVSQEELVWHRDKEDRIVHRISGEGWLIQFDNQLPIEIDNVFVPAEAWHRVIKGTGDLVIKIN